MCNGAATGFQCRHYWPVVFGEPTVKTADGSLRVRRQRLCTITGDGDDLGMDGAAQARWCGRYEASARVYYPSFEEAKIKQHVPAGTELSADADQMISDNIMRLKEQAHAILRARATGMGAVGSPSVVTEPSDKQVIEEMLRGGSAAIVPNPAVSITTAPEDTSDKPNS